MGNKYKPNKVYSFLDIFMICLLAWLVIGVTLVFFDEQLMDIVRFVLGG